MTDDRPLGTRYIDLADCQNCPHNVARLPIPADGNAHAKPAPIGQGTGRAEIAQGRPCVGPTGQLLNLTLEDRGLKREELYITNAVLCKPADGHDPDPRAVDCCRPRLIAELQD